MNPEDLKFGGDTLPKPERLRYNHKTNNRDRLEVEVAVAEFLCESQNAHDVVKLVLEKFRPDLFVTTPEKKAE